MQKNSLSLDTVELWPTDPRKKKSPDKEQSLRKIRFKHFLELYRRHTIFYN